MINIPQQAAQALLDAARGGESLIPPYIPTFYWNNGNPKLKQAHPVVYYGGWCTDTDRFDTILNGFGKPYPPVLQEIEMVSSNGKEYTVYGSRSLFIMPIKQNWVWRVQDVEGDKWTYSKEFVKGSRSVLWWVAYLADRIGEAGAYEYIPWGTVLLKATGYQSTFLRDAVKAWETYTDPVRKEMTGKLRKDGKWNSSETISASWFWMPVGSFGDIKTQMVGGGEQSLVTPISPYVPEGKLTEEILSSLYVGEEVLNDAVKALDEVKPWIDSFDNVVEEEVSGTVESGESNPEDESIPW